MKYFIDLDNTLCFTESSDYINSKPTVERINYLRDLKDSGHQIIPIHNIKKYIF